MPITNAVTRKANKATASDLAVSIPPTHVVCHKNFSFSIKTTFDLFDHERVQIWRIFEENMHALYLSSSFGWNPQEKEREMFNPLSRFILVRELSDPPSDPSSDIVAYSMFRFEREEGQNVVYCYELQVSRDSRRFGLGRLIMQMLTDVGAEWGMTKVVLTVLKANHGAVSFYRSIGQGVHVFPGTNWTEVGAQIQHRRDVARLSRRRRRRDMPGLLHIM